MSTAHREHSEILPYPAIVSTLDEHAGDMSETQCRDLLRLLALYANAYGPVTSDTTVGEIAGDLISTADEAFYAPGEYEALRRWASL